MTSKDFQDECEQRIGGRLWENVFNVDYQQAVSLTIEEMRSIVNALREHENMPRRVVVNVVDYIRD